MARWENLRVCDVVTKIKDEQMVLPVIQRRLVWNEGKMILLFDSLLKGNSFGSIICIDEETQSKPLFAYRKFTNDGNPTKAIEYSSVKQSHKLIVDGQQRLQSFYIGLTGTYEGKQMYFDLYSDFANSEYDFNFAQSLDQLPKKNADKPIQECFWYSVQELYYRLKDTNDAEQVSEEIIA
ncbi:MAG: DUF262 domain-containing protein, partial [Bacilli bacterium]|nr:DUF262 domain-containing protein [Bacilli bacterium]